jgi:hypothetical protein
LRLVGSDPPVAKLDRSQHMFPSQPQIGQDMAKERQQQAEQIRQAQLALTANKQKRSGNERRPGLIDATTLKHRLAGLIALLTKRRSKQLPLQEK